MDSRPNSPTPTYIHSSPPHTEHTEAAMFLNLLVMVDIFSSESFIQARNQRLPRMFFFFGCGGSSALLKLSGSSLLCVGFL